MQNDYLRIEDMLSHKWSIAKYKVLKRIIFSLSWLSHLDSVLTLTRTSLDFGQRWTWLQPCNIRPLNDQCNHIFLLIFINYTVSVLWSLQSVFWFTVRWEWVARPLWFWLISWYTRGFPYWTLLKQWNSAAGSSRTEAFSSSCGLLMWVCAVWSDAGLETSSVCDFKCMWGRNYQLLALIKMKEILQKKTSTWII